MVGGAGGRQGQGKGEDILVMLQEATGAVTEWTRKKMVGDMM